MKDIYDSGSILSFGVPITVSVKIHLTTTQMYGSTAYFDMYYKRINSENNGFSFAILKNGNAISSSTDLDSSSCYWLGLA